MAKSRLQKAEIVAGLKDRLGRAKGIAFVQASSFTMNDANALREKAHENNADIFIAKKTLLTLAAREAGIEGFEKSTLEGSVLAAVSYGDEIAAARLLKEYSKGKEKQKVTVKFLAGVLEGQVISADKVSQLASLPTKQQLLGQLVGTLNAPVSGFVNVLAGNLRGLVTVLSAVQEKKA